MKQLLLGLRNTDDTAPLCPQQEHICAKGNDAVKSISDAKQQRNASQRRHPDSGCIQCKCNAVIDRIRDNRFKHHVIRFAKTVEGRVEHILNGVQHVEANEEQYEAEQLVYIREAKQHVPEQRIVQASLRNALPL